MRPQFKTPLTTDLTPLPVLGSLIALAFLRLQKCQSSELPLNRPEFPLSTRVERSGYAASETEDQTP